MKLVGFAVLGVFAVGCAAAKPAPVVAAAASTTTTTAATSDDAPVAPAVAAASADEPVAAAAEPEPQPEPEPVPTACVGEQAFKDTKACILPGAFVKKMCSASYPDMALSLFAKGTPWTRAWLAGDVEAWSASGGFTSRAELAFDEEVIVLTRHSAPSAGGVVMTSAGASYDVLRWDGSCVSVQEGELTSKRPPAPKPATMSWNRLEEATKRALLTSSKVKTSHAALEKACTGDKSACDRAEKDFATAIANTVRAGSTPLPTPSRRP